MLSEQMQKSLNEQVNAELFSSYLYLSMNAYFKSVTGKQRFTDRKVREIFN